MNCSVGVGAQRWNTSLPQAFDELRAGMSVGIVFPGRNNAEAWLDGGKEFRNGGVFAAVMAGRPLERQIAEMQDRIRKACSTRKVSPRRQEEENCVREI